MDGVVGEFQKQFEEFGQAVPKPFFKTHELLI